MQKKELLLTMQTVHNYLKSQTENKLKIRSLRTM